MEMGLGVLATSHGILDKFRQRDVWTLIAQRLDGSSCIRLGATSSSMNNLISDNSIWKTIFLRDIGIADVIGEEDIDTRWKQLYAAAYDGSHTFQYVPNANHIVINDMPRDHLSCRRIGAFRMGSQSAILRSWYDEDDVPETPGSTISRVRRGIWIADQHTLQRADGEDFDVILDVRHADLFLSEEFKGGQWMYHLVGSDNVNFHNLNSASALIGDMQSHPMDAYWDQPLITPHAVRMTNTFRVNEGLLIAYYHMIVEEEVVAMQIHHMHLRVDESGQIHINHPFHPDYDLCNFTD